MGSRGNNEGGQILNKCSNFRFRFRILFQGKEFLFRGEFRLVKLIKGGKLIVWNYKYVGLLILGKKDFFCISVKFQKFSRNVFIIDKILENYILKFLFCL